MTKPNWHRIAALEAAAIVWQHRPLVEGEDRTGAVLGTAERMVAWLDAYVTDAAVRPEKPWNAGVAEKVRGMSEAAARLRVDVTNGGSTPEVPPRNVPTTDDGSMTVPVYRFYEQPVDLVAGPVKPIYWREDTRNEVNRWSMWSDEQRWYSNRLFDKTRPPQLLRIRADELPHYVSTETRHDTEE